jgi:3-dehydroquinate dehydratase-2
MKNGLVISGPNLNMLGTREPEIYGNETLLDIEKYVNSKIPVNELNLDWFQSNIEGEIIEKIHHCFLKNDEYDFLIINPGAYSHTSVAIYDALKMVKKNKIEVHLSNTHAREMFRKNRIIAENCNGIVEGFGKKSYLLAALSQL